MVPVQQHRAEMAFPGRTVEVQLMLSIDQEKKLELGFKISVFLNVIETLK